MTSPNDIAELILETHGGAEANIDERVGSLVFQAEISNQDLIDRWLALKEVCPSFLQAVTINSADTDAEVTADYSPVDNEKIRVTLLKATNDDQTCIFFGGSISKLRESLNGVSSVRIADLPDNGTFTTERTRFCKWIISQASDHNCSELLSDPRNYSRDFTGQNHLPKDIRPWLIRTKPEEESSAFTAWQKITARKLMAVLANQITIDNGRIIYSFNGPPIRKFHIDDDHLLPLIDRLSESAQWIFLDAKDSEVRHLFVSNEWGRSLNIDDLGVEATESAKRTYEAYAKASGKETLKALTELRKSVLEESQKIAERAHNLARALWKDLAIASSPFVLKVFSQADKAQNDLVAAIFSFIAAIFLLFAFGSQIILNFRFFNSQKSARKTWNRPLLEILSNEELQKFSEKPIEDGVKDYKFMAWVVGVIYAALIAVLLWFGSVNFVDYKANNKIADVTAVQTETTDAGVEVTETPTSEVSVSDITKKPAEVSSQTDNEKLKDGD